MGVAGAAYATVISQGVAGIYLASPIAWIAATIPLGVTYFKRINKMLDNKNKFNISYETESIVS